MVKRSRMTPNFCEKLHFTDLLDKPEPMGTRQIPAMRKPTIEGSSTDGG